MDTSFDNRLIVRNPELLSASVEDHLVLLDSVRGEYFDLDPVATDIWQRLETPQRADALHKALADIYEGDPATIRDDVLTFLQDMLARGMIRLEEPGPATP